MKNAAVALALIGLMASPLAAQSRRGRDGGQRIPPGHMPPPGMCRVWYEGVPPGRQPSPMNCRDAETIASRGSGARVIYGDDDRWGRERDRSRDRRTTYPYPDRDG